MSETGTGITTIHESLTELLKSQFVTMEHYNQLISEKRLVHPKTYHDDRTLEKQHPDHPMASSNRFRRIKLADLVRDTARDLTSELPQDVLTSLHTALFDCCAAVRHSLTTALFYCGSRRSAYYLGRLIEEDGESAMVRTYARIARERCLMREDFLFDEKKPVVLLISQNIDLASSLLKLTERECALFHMPEPNYTELMAWSSEVQVVDRWLMGQENWNSYCDYLDEVNETETTYPLRDEDGDVLVEEPLYDHTPLIIIDQNMNKSIKEFRDPNKPKDKVYYIGEGTTDVVTKLVEYVLTSRPIVFKEVIEEVNRERGAY